MMVSDILIVSFPTGDVFYFSVVVPAVPLIVNGDDITLHLIFAIHEHNGNEIRVLGVMLLSLELKTVVTVNDEGLGLIETSGSFLTVSGPSSYERIVGVVTVTRCECQYTCYKRDGEK